MPKLDAHVQRSEPDRQTFNAQLQRLLVVPAPSSIERWTLSVERWTLPFVVPNQNTAFRKTLLRWYAGAGRDLPWRRTRDPYAILVSEVMLQQTQVATVIPYYERWLKLFPNLTALAAAAESDVLHAWQGLGYYSRARNLHAASKLIVRQHDGAMPNDAIILRQLPGMGRYTANAVATFAFDKRLPIVEANVSRAIARIFDIRAPIDSSPGRKQLWDRAAAMLPEKHPGRFNSALMELGALICRKVPRCDLCPVREFCQASDPEKLPVKKPRPATKCLTETHSLVIKARRIIMEQCEGRWRGMWMLPRLRNKRRNSHHPIYSSIFPFTNHRVTLQVFTDDSVYKGDTRSLRSTTAAGSPSKAAVIEQAADLTYSAAAETKEPALRWFQIDQLNTIPIPSPHRRAITALLHPDVCLSGSDR